MPLAFPTFATAIPAAPVIPPSGITIAAETWRWDGNSGVVRVSSGAFMQPGYVTAANLNQYRVFVGGVEQAVAVRAADGAFPDGSYRSVITQFMYNLTNNVPVASEIRINQGVRGTVDIAFVEPTYAIVSKKAVIAPTDPVYLCATMGTLTPLTPATNDTGTDLAWGAKAHDDWLSNAAIRLGAISPGTATYDHPVGLMNIRHRTGERVFYQWAWDWATELKGSTIVFSESHMTANYMIPPTDTVYPVGATTNAAGYGIGATSVTLAAAGSGAFYANGTTVTFAGQATVYTVTVDVADVSLGGTLTFTPGLVAAIPAVATAITATLDENVRCSGGYGGSFMTTWNPEHLNGSSSGGSCGFLNEAWSMRMHSHAVMYWATGWRQFKRNIACYANRALAYPDIATDYVGWRDYKISSSWGVRYNFGGQGLNAILFGYLTGCTTSHAQASIGGANASWDYATWLPLVLQALEEKIWAMGSGDYRDGLIGQDHHSIANQGGWEAYGVTNFQLTIVTEFLALYYDHVYPDSRIPVWIKAILDYQIAQSRAQTSLDFTYPNSPYVSSYDNLPPAVCQDPTFTATLTAKGTQTGATTTAAGTANNYLAASQTVVLAAAGSGSLLAGDGITFAGQSTHYRVVVGLANVATGGAITIAPGLQADITAGAKAVTTVGTMNMTYTGGTTPVTLIQGVNNPPTPPSLGPVNTVPRYRGFGMMSAGAIAFGTAITDVIGTTISFTPATTATGSKTCQLQFAGWYLQMFFPAFAWYYAYSGNSTYQTWATRASVTSAIDDGQTKTWGEVFGGGRQGALYYRHGGAIRGTPGAHPTVITNPPLQPVLG